MEKTGPFTKLENQIQVIQYSEKIVYKKSSNYYKIPQIWLFLSSRFPRSILDRSPEYCSYVLFHSIYTSNTYYTGLGYDCNSLFCNIWHFLFGFSNIQKKEMKRKINKNNLFLVFNWLFGSVIEQKRSCFYINTALSECPTVKTGYK